MTRSEAESDLLEIVRGGITLAGISTVTDTDGNVPELNSTLRQGLKAVGVTPAARTVTDDDLAMVPAGDEDKLVASAAVWLIDNRVLPWIAARPNWSNNGNSETWSPVYDFWAKLAAQLREQAGQAYGTGPGLIQTGSMNLGVLSSWDEDEEW